MIGQTLSQFKITAKLGEGGMGEVYRAEDTKLGREVAIKVLPEAFTTDPERMARFEREARVLAALNHPSIAAIYDLAEAEGTHFLVLELVEGDNLANLIERGPISSATAMHIALQIAEALEAAHGHGIVHRDLKPANIMVGSGDLIKVLDFGLAKVAPMRAAEIDTTHSPTRTAPMTETGVIMGTAAYMSPEQARGQDVDKQADIWAFGVVLWEMLTGRRLFDGQTVSDILAAVLRADIDWGALPDEAPAGIHRLLARCLEREPRQRLHDIADARIEVEAAMVGPRDRLEAVEESSVTPRRKRLLQVAGLVVLTALTTTAVLRFGNRDGPDSGRSLFLNLDLPVTEPIKADKPFFPIFALSPDGRTLVYVSWPEGQEKSLLLARSLDHSESRVLAGTEGATQPFFSPDGDWVGFHAAGELKKVSLKGGLAVSLCPVEGLRGASWAENGTIYFSSQRGSGILKLMPGASEPKPITHIDKKAGEAHHRWPQVLPDGKGLLFTVVPPSLRHTENRFAVVSFTSGEIAEVHAGGISARYVDSGHLLYGLQGQLMAVPFDLGALAVTGPALPVLENVRMAESGEASMVQLDLDANGSMLYVQGYQDPVPRELVWVDRQGDVELILDEQRTYRAPSLSPSGERVAMTMLDGPNANLWVLDLIGQSFSQLTIEMDHWAAIWSPNGLQLAFSSNLSGQYQVFTMPADGSEEASQLTHSDLGAFPSSWSPTTDEILVDWRAGRGRGLDVWSVPLSGDPPNPVISSAGFDGMASFSPDGRWITYVSSESGTYEVYAQAYPDLARKWQVSRGGGGSPRWSRAGDEIFYFSGKGWVSVPVDTSGEFRVGTPATAFSGRFVEPAFLETNYDFDPKTDRFLAMREPETHRAEMRLVFVTNWLVHLEQLVPGAR